jgi:MacB-like periplasmic core domain
MDRMFAGVSTRRFAVVGEPVGDEVEQESTATLKSTLPELFIERGPYRVSELMGRRLDDVRLAVMMLDGLEIAERPHVVALAISTEQREPFAREVVVADRPGHRARRGDGQRHVRPHRHHQPRFHTIFASSYSHTDLVISGKSRVSDLASGNAVLPASLVASVQRLPDVRDAKGTILNLTGNADQVKLLDRDGKVIGSSDNPRFGFGIDRDAQKFSPFELKSGQWMSGGDDVVIDADTAAKHHFGPGDTIRVSGTGRVRPYKVVGVTRFGDVNSLGGATEVKPRVSVSGTRDHRLRDVDAHH